MELLSKSKAAFRLSVETFFHRVSEGKHQAYLWTFTMRDCVDVDVAFRRWTAFAKALWHFGINRKTGKQTLVGLRVAELHPGGHGVHFHVLLSRRINVNIMRRICRRYGFGWIHATRAYHGDGSMGAYLSKYLSKQDRPACLRGRRMWQAFGKWGHTRCGQVEVESEFCYAFRARRQMLRAAAKVAMMEGREYRMEGALETMFHAEEHCWRVRTGQSPPLAPHLWYIPPDADSTPMGYDDWDGVWHEVAHGRN